MRDSKGVRAPGPGAQAYPWSNAGSKVISLKGVFAFLSEFLGDYQRVVV